MFKTSKKDLPQIVQCEYCSEEVHRILLLHELGITGLDDYGEVVKETMPRVYYRDVAHLGPFSLTVDVSRFKIDSAANPKQARFHNLKNEIKIWFERLKKLENPNGKP